MVKILFVCLGNICRSPAADGVMQSKVKELGLEDKFFIDSAGTSAVHAGEPADSRMRAHAAKRGYQLESISRGLEAVDLTNFELILAMDTANYKGIIKLAGINGNDAKVKMFTEFCRSDVPRDVPDPYYGGEDGFEEVLDIVEDGVDGIIKAYK